MKILIPGNLIYFDGCLHKAYHQISTTKLQENLK